MRNSQQIKNDILDVRSKLNAMVRHSLEPLVQRLNRATANAAIDLNLRGEVVNAKMALEAEEANHAVYADLTRALAQLEAELEAATSAERLGKITDAKARMLALSNDFDAACRTVCRIYEQMLDQQDIYNRTLPGYTAIQMPEVDFKHMTPAGWVGTTSDHIRSHSLQWLNSEKDKAA